MKGCLWRELHPHSTVFEMVVSAVGLQEPLENDYEQEEAEIAEVQSWYRIHALLSLLPPVHLFNFLLNGRSGWDRTSALQVMSLTLYH